MYSTTSTLRLVGGVALAVAALVLVLVAAVNFAATRSAPVMLATMLTVVVAGSLAMIFVIQSLSTPKAAKLTTAVPSSATLVHVHRQKVYRWAMFPTILLAVCAVLGLILPGNAKYVVLCFGGIAWLLTLILLPVMYFNARNFDRSLTALECDPWVHWQYALAQWQEWTDIQVGRMKPKPPGVVLNSPEKIRARLLKAAPEVYFGHDGIFCDGIYSTWLGLSTYLVSASIDARQPRSLLFNFEKVVPNPYTANQVIPIQQSVLIPSGAEADIARLQRELMGRCPKARIALLDG